MILPKLDDAIKNLPKDQQADQAKKQAAAGDSQLAAAQTATSSSQTASSQPATCNVESFTDTCGLLNVFVNYLNAA